MAKVALNPVLETLHGKVGDLVFRRYHDDVIITRTPGTAGRPPTGGQAAVREQFRLATVYGKAVMADPAKKEVYASAAARKGVPAFALAIGDFFHPPVVDEIDLSAYTGHTGDTIRVRASDDVKVTGVALAIRDTGGTVLEQGPANAQDGMWVYHATTNLTTGQHVSIEVTATDLPGHTGKRTEARA